MENESHVYQNKYDIHILCPQEKDRVASLSLVWIQGKMEQLCLLKFKTFPKKSLNPRGIYERQHLTPWDQANGS